MAAQQEEQQGVYSWEKAAKDEQSPQEDQEVGTTLHLASESGR